MRRSRRRNPSGVTRAVLMPGETTLKHSGVNAGIWSARSKTLLGSCGWLDDRKGSGRDSGLLARLVQSVDRCQDALRQIAGLNREVYDALELIAGGF